MTGLLQKVNERAYLATNECIGAPIAQVDGQESAGCRLRLARHRKHCDNDNTEYH